MPLNPLPPALKVAGLAALIALGSAATAAAQTKELTPVRLRLDWTWQGPQSIWTSAAEKGFFREEGLDVTIDRGYGGLENASALASGNYDFLFGDINNVMLFNAKSPDHKLLCVMVIYDAYPGSVITWKGNGINLPKDLENKSIAAPLTSGGRTMFPAFAKANGIDESKINWQTIGMQLLEPQFVKHAYDAIATFTTTGLLNLKQVGVRRDQLTIFNFSDYGVDMYGQGLVVRADSAANKPEVIRKFLRATVKGLKFMLANKKEAVETLKKRDPMLDVAIEVDRLDLMVEMFLKRPPVEKFGVGYVDPDRLNRSINTIATVFHVTPVPAAAEVYDGSFLPPDSERMLHF